MGFPIVYNYWQIKPICKFDLFYKNFFTDNSSVKESTEIYIRGVNNVCMQIVDVTDKDNNTNLDKFHNTNNETFAFFNDFIVSFL